MHLQQEWTDTLIHLGIPAELAKAAASVLASPNGIAQSPEEQRTIQQVWQSLRGA